VRVDLSFLWVGDNEPHGPPVESPHESGGREARHDGRFLARPIHQVQVAVLARLRGVLLTSTGLVRLRGRAAVAAAGHRPRLEIATLYRDARYRIGRPLFAVRTSTAH
jgi:hypothetical protein